MRLRTHIYIYAYTDCIDVYVEYRVDIYVDVTVNIYIDVTVNI